MLSKEKHYCPDFKKNTPVADTTVKKLVLPMEQGEYIIIIK